ncbi:PAS-like proteinGGDEF protein [Pseudomonas syringae pv. cilantro]|uniref:PAS-like proteinGGDEF protein n=1 Tax=Pseudomonas syringae pv. cilantro TaxID=81035 RepID=A0A0N0X841_PSESX|nr:PAS-like proteinGGDEF protein [Pseudomonas syringae pv. cilantro]
MTCVTPERIVSQLHTALQIEGQDIFISCSILSLGRTLNLDITAEQGYLLNRPMRSEALLRIIRSAAECSA